MFDKVEAVTIPKWRLKELELKESQEIQELKQKVAELEAGIFSLLCGENPDNIEVVRQLILKDGCKGHKCGHPLDPPDYDCPYNLIGDCESCPIVTEQYKETEKNEPNM